MDLSILEKLDLGVLEKVCQVFFEQMGFTTKSAGQPTTLGVSGLSVLYSKSSNAPFSLCQCAVGQARINLNLLGQFRDSLAKTKLPSGYFVTSGSPDLTVRDFAAANKINLIDGLKFTELINNLPAASCNLLNETIATTQNMQQFIQTGRFQSLANTSGSFQQQANETGRHQRVVEIGPPPNCAKCGQRMQLQVSTGKYSTGKYWQCPNPNCGHISALV